MDVSRSLGALEHRYGCKFITGASHGVVSLSGIVSDKKVKLLAEKCAAANPDVRAVANHVRIAGAAPESLDPQPVLQPSIGQKIYFVDGIFGTIQQVVIDPDNRRVTAMTLSGQFGEPQESGSLHGNADPRERCIVIGMPLVRHLTSTSGFLNIRSDRSELYSEFDNASFFTPGADWTPPYPYCSLEVLFPSQHQPEEDPIPQAVPGQASTNRSQEQLQWEELLASESLGG
jgi:hypothetical protein